MEHTTLVESMDVMALLNGMGSAMATRGSTVATGAEQTESERISLSLQRE